MITFLPRHQTIMWLGLCKVHEWVFDNVEIGRVIEVTRCAQFGISSIDLELVIFTAFNQRQNWILDRTKGFGNHGRTDGFRGFARVRIKQA